MMLFAVITILLWIQLRESLLSNTKIEEKITQYRFVKPQPPVTSGKSITIDVIPDRTITMVLEI